MKESCTFNYFNITSIKPAMLDEGDEIILANWLNKKSLEYASNKNIPVQMPNYSYVLVKRSILCSCKIDTEESFFILISSLPWQLYPV